MILRLRSHLLGCLLCGLAIVCSWAQAHAITFDGAVNLAVAGKTPQALEVLAGLEMSHQIAPDLIHLTRARIYFQTAKLDEAIAEYNKIPETSAFWLTSLDEKSQAFGRKGQYAKVISTLQTAMAPMFKDRVSPEIYFTAALTDLKICDYASVFDMTDKFKTNFSPHLARLATQVKSLNPRDREMAAREIKAINSVTNKLQIIEAEVIERISVAQKGGERPEQGKIQSGTDVLRFKVTNDIWVDELDNYQAKVKECPAYKPLRISGPTSARRPTS